MINYPTGSKPNHHHTKKTEHTHNTIYGSRGMSLEDKINQSNEYYLTHHLAVIHKKPTPVQVVKVDYPRRSAAKIVEAYYRHASTTDYNGVYQGFYIDFEAMKSVKSTGDCLYFSVTGLHVDDCDKRHLCICEKISMCSEKER